MTAAVYVGFAELHRAKAAELRKLARHTCEGLIRAEEARRAREHERAAELYDAMARDADPVVV